MLVLTPIIARSDPRRRVSDRSASGGRLGEGGGTPGTGRGWMKNLGLAVDTAKVSLAFLLSINVRGRQHREHQKLACVFWTVLRLREHCSGDYSRPRIIGSLSIQTIPTKKVLRVSCQEVNASSNAVARTVQTQECILRILVLKSSPRCPPVTIVCLSFARRNAI